MQGNSRTAWETKHIKATETRLGIRAPYQDWDINSDSEVRDAGTNDTHSRSRIRVAGVETVYTVSEVAMALRWSYDSVRRYFKDLPGVLVKHQPRRYRRSYRTYMIPLSVFQQEWQKMANVNTRGVK